MNSTISIAIIKEWLKKWEWKSAKVKPLSEPSYEAGTNLMIGFGEYSYMRGLLLELLT